jgi:hypothetical protein
MTGPEGGAFRLTKWYFDCVEPGGRVVIGYWVSLAWGGLSIPWSSVTLYAPNAPPSRRSGMVRADEPLRDGRSLWWDASGVGCALEAELLQTGPAICLLSRDDGDVDWSCVAPAAAVRARLDGHAPVEGFGYIERLVVTLLPWHLPIRELRWGRWIAADAARSLVWIDWRGDAPATWVLCDGALRRGGAVSETQIRAGGETLEIANQRVLHARRLDDVIRAIGPLRSLVPPTLLATEDTRWAGQGVLSGPEGRCVAGTAISELVRFA